MKYNQPFDQPSSPDAAYVDGNPGSGIQGSIPPAASIEYPQREIVHVVSEAGLTPDNADLFQLLRSIRGGKLTTYTDTGTANHLVIAPTTAHTGESKGLPFRIFPANTSASTTVDLTVNARAAVRLKKRDGTDPAVGDIVTGVPIDVVYDGTNYRVIGWLPSDTLAGLVSQASIYNVQQFTKNTRTTMTGNAGNSYTVTGWSPGNYAKKSATSALVLFVTIPTGTAAASAASTMTVTVGGSSQSCPIGNNITGFGSPLNPLILVIPGLGSGNQAVTVSFSRNDSTTWSDSVCPNSSDLAFLPAATTAAIVIGELGA